MASSTSPIQDPAAPILSAEPMLSDEHRADLWDAFHSKNPAELEQHLQNIDIPVPEDTKNKLLDAKNQMAAPPVVEPLDKTTVAINKLAALDPKILDIAESHPHVLKALTTASNAPEKAVSVASGATSAKKGSSSPKEPEIAPDVPPTPSGHFLAQTSDGGLYHLPHASLDKARQIDPKLQILHVEP